MWSYGVTTVPSRRYTTFEPTLLSLKEAGFPHPWIFADGCNQPEAYETHSYMRITTRHPRVGAFGNWIMALWELYIREPKAQWFALFQDDILLCKNLKQYFEASGFFGEFINLYSNPENEKFAQQANEEGWFENNQLCRS